ncbi:YifB family Mg chelatase-like AAA ATPase [Bartonella sp. F02]|uniref:YifB family Mg chelatase-like AAA ATPase n=1 Tax=Bartonella sp. F02 TaxID=2967262 RepID=UPI0022A903D4|nr:YifB family Mg chelatase-like AAA ATPase [Bartonella sp. F02]MCZ2327967.1 YifB family Mg chelatase-like AAA ATPase [Bartonella sp. F02]
MIAHVTTVAFRGLDAVPVDVQVMISPGKIGMAIVGLADKAIAESRERVQAALHACGLSMPIKRVTINLAPADLPKEGSHYDLPIAMGLMLAMGLLPSEVAQKYIILGELSLDGSITAVNGVLPAAITASSLNKGLICPYQCGSEAAWANAEMDILAPDCLLTMVNHFKGTQIQKRPQPRQYATQTELPDLCEIKGQKIAKRALEVCAAGRHNLLFVGPPGAGKSMLAQRLPSILPPLDSREILDVSLIASISGETIHKTISHHCPFRSPHHSASMAAMIGGGLKGRPGEVSLAHNGVLFLDELPEFSPKVLDSLRQPLESGECIIARANHHISYPARIQLIAAMNPCRCGMAGENGYICAKGDRCRIDYQSRISGPLLDRIDLRIDVPALTAMDLMQPEQSEKSCDVAKRVARARTLQTKRFSALDLAHIRTNGDCPAKIIEEIAIPDKDAAILLRDVSEKMHISARSYHRILKVARTIADLDESEHLARHHIAEAVSYRLGSERLTAHA